MRFRGATPCMQHGFGYCRDIYTPSMTFDVKECSCDMVPAYIRHEDAIMSLRKASDREESEVAYCSAVTSDVFKQSYNPAYTQPSFFKTPPLVARGANDTPVGTNTESTLTDKYL